MIDFEKLLEYHTQVTQARERDEQQFMNFVNSLLSKFDKPTLDNVADCVLNTLQVGSSIYEMLDFSVSNTEATDTKTYNNYSFVKNELLSPTEIATIKIVYVSSFDSNKPNRVNEYFVRYKISSESSEKIPLELRRKTGGFFASDKISFNG